jgi:hypothetical protein
LHTSPRRWRGHAEIVVSKPQQLAQARKVANIVTVALTILLHIAPEAVIKKATRRAASRGSR